MQDDGWAGPIAKFFDAAAQTIVAECVDLANRSMKTTLVDALFRRNVTPVLARRLAQRLWNGA